MKQSRKTPGPQTPPCPGSAVDKQTEGPRGKTQQHWKTALHSVLWFPFMFIVKKGEFLGRGSGPRASGGGWVKPGWEGGEPGTSERTLDITPDLR